MLVCRLSDALTREHDLDDDNEEELDGSLEDENTDEDEFVNYDSGVI